MRKTNDENIRIKDRLKASGRKKYVRPELTKREKAVKVIGGEPVITS